MKNSKTYAWLVVAMLWGVAFLNYMDRQMLSTMRDAMALDIAELQSKEMFGMLMGIFLWIYGFMSPVSGYIADRLNRKWLIVGSLFVWSTVTLCMGLCTSFTQIYWLRALMGVSEALYIPAGLSLIADYHSGGSRSLAVGLHMTGLYAGQAIGGFGATVAAASSWQATFHWFGIIGIAYAVVLILCLRDVRPAREPQPLEKADAAPKPSDGGPVLSIVRNAAFWVLLIYFAASSLPGWAIKNWLPTLFSENLSMDMASAGPLATITIAASSLVGVLFGGTLSDRWVKRAMKGRVFTSAIGLGMTIPALLLLGLGHNVVTAAGAGILFGVGYGMFDANNMPILCQFVSARRRATAYGVMNMVGVFAGAVITNVLGGWGDKGSLGLGFSMLSVVVAVVVVMLLVCLRPKADNIE